MTKRKARNCIEKMLKEIRYMISFHRLFKPVSLKTAILKATRDFNKHKPITQ